MKKNYFNQIENEIKSLEIKKKIRTYKDNSDTLITYWTIGKLLVEAQGGENHARYGNELIKKWSNDLSKKYGKGYGDSNLRRFRQFYIVFKKCAPVEHELNWTHFKVIMPLKDENERNYYINEVIEKIYLKVN